MADLAGQVQNLPSQLAADLTLGVPLVLFVVLVVLSAHTRSRRWH